jgi:hypothetical protein
VGGAPGALAAELAAAPGDDEVTRVAPRELERARGGAALEAPEGARDDELARAAPRGELRRARGLREGGAGEGREGQQREGGDGGERE